MKALSLTNASTLTALLSVAPAPSATAQSAIGDTQVLHVYGPGGPQALFSLFGVIYVSRWVVFTAEARRVFSHFIVFMFLGAGLPDVLYQ
jgi:hypothetical protein